MRDLWESLPGPGYYKWAALGVLVVYVVALWWGGGRPR